MFQRDYILRMIEMMGDLMRRVKELMDELAQMRLLEEVCRRQCGLPLSALETLSTESLTEMLSPTPRLFASELLYLRATASPARWEEGRMLRLKSLAPAAYAGAGRSAFASCAQRACRRSSWS